MAANTNYSINKMSKEDYRKYIKFMIDEITDITDLRQLFTITQRKFTRRRISSDKN